MAVIITPDTTRFDLMDGLAREGFGIIEPDALLESDSDAYRWRWFLDALVEQMSGTEFRSAFDYLCRMHDVDTIELDSVAYTIQQALECTPEAAAGLREYVFDSTSDSLASLRQLDVDLSMCGAWWPDFDALEEDGYTERDGILYEKQEDGAPVECEADVWFDKSFGYFVMWR